MALNVMMATPVGIGIPARPPNPMTAGAGAVAPFMLTVAVNDVLLPPSLTITEILLALTEPETEPAETTGFSP